MAGWAANQNRATSLSQSTSLPSDALQKYLVEYEPIRVHDLEPRVDNAGTASIQDAERTFSLMNYFSNSLGVNCTYCHNTRALHDLDQATPQLPQAQLGIGMALELNNDYLLPLGEVLPASRLGALHADAPKVACATCHKGHAEAARGPERDRGLAGTRDRPGRPSTNDRRARSRTGPRARLEEARDVNRVRPAPQPRCSTACTAPPTCAACPTASSPPSLTSCARS